MNTLKFLFLQKSSLKKRSKLHDLPQCQDAELSKEWNSARLHHSIKNCLWASVFKITNIPLSIKKEEEKKESF